MCSYGHLNLSLSPPLFFFLTSSPSLVFLYPMNPFCTIFSYHLLRKLNITKDSLNILKDILTTDVPPFCFESLSYFDIVFFNHISYIFFMTIKISLLISSKNFLLSIVNRTPQ